MGRKAKEKWGRRLAATAVPWSPFNRAWLSQADMDKFGIKEQPEIYRNSRYQVTVYRIPAQRMVHLSVKRIDKEPIHDWRDLQRIKNELCGPDVEAVELYPAEDRLVDDANQYHLWVMMDPKFRFPFGFAERLVSEGSAFGAKQRPFPADNKPVGLREVDEETERGRVMKRVSPLMTPKCTRNHPNGVHAHVGCMAKGCDCQHGIPSTVGELLANKFSKDEIEPLPDHFKASFEQENPDIDINDFAAGKTE